MRKHARKGGQLPTPKGMGIHAKLIMKKNYKVIIAEGRNFNDYTLLKERCDFFLRNKLNEGRVVIVIGQASGADALGERYARETHLSIEVHPADWKKHGRAAGPIRNAEMAEVADALIAFWRRTKPGNEVDDRTGEKEEPKGVRG